MAEPGEVVGKDYWSAQSVVVTDAGAAAAGIEVVVEGSAVRVPAADSGDVEGIVTGMVVHSDDEMVAVLAREDETVAVVAVGNADELVETVVEAEVAAWLVELVLETGMAESASSWADAGSVWVA